MKLSLIILLCLILSISKLNGQDIPRYNHYFTYSYIYNPAFLGKVEASQLNMIYRKQWVGLEGAPEYMHAGLQLPLSNNIAIGLNASNLEQGLIMETSAMGSLAYTVNLGLGKTLSFGISIGAGRTALDDSQITDFSDPAIAGALDKSFYMEGQAGLSLNINHLNIAISLPTIFEKRTFSQEDFQEVRLGPLNSTFSSISYRFDFSPKFSFEPMGVYRMDNQLEDQWQGYATIYYSNLLWLGGSYADGYGSAAYAGVQVNDFLKVGYSFDFSSNELSAYNSHEFYLSLRIGQKKIERTPKVISNKSDFAAANVDDKQEVIEDDVAGPDKIVQEEVKEDTEYDKANQIENRQVEVAVKEVFEEPVSNTDDVEAQLDETAKEVEEQIIENENNDDIEELSGMEPGYYVVVGAFVHERNAKSFMQQLSNGGYPSDTRFNLMTQYHYVYLLHSTNHDEAVSLRNKIRKLDVFKFDEAWILTIN